MFLDTIVLDSGKEIIRIVDVERSECVALEQIGDSLSRSLKTECPYSFGPDGSRAITFSTGEDVGIERLNDMAFRLTFTLQRWSIFAEQVAGFRTYVGRHRVHQWLAGPMAIEELAFGERSLLLTDSLEGGW